MHRIFDPNLPWELQLPRHFMAGGVYAKELHMRQAGAKVVGHAHVYDHLSLLTRGSARVTVDGVSTDYTSPTALTIVAGKQHEIVALADDTLWYCLHAIPEDLRDTDLLDEVLVQQAGGKAEG